MSSLSLPHNLHNRPVAQFVPHLPFQRVSLEEPARQFKSEPGELVHHTSPIVVAHKRQLVSAEHDHQGAGGEERDQASGRHLLHCNCAPARAENELLFDMASWRSDQLLHNSDICEQHEHDAQACVELFRLPRVQQEVQGRGEEKGRASEKELFRLHTGCCIFFRVPFSQFISAT